MENKIIIIGAGISGLTCSYHLESKGAAYNLLEAAPKAGGLCSSYVKEGFTFDCSGHLLHISTETILKFIQKLLGKSILLHKRKAAIHIYDKEAPFPFQNNLHALPEDIIKECVQGVIAAHKEKILDTSMFKHWALALYGKGICKHFMFPYNKKLWQTDLNSLTSQWCGKFVPKSAFEDIIKGAYSSVKKDFGYNAHFFYPKSGGCQAICDAMLKKTKNIQLNSKVSEINLKNKMVKVNGKLLNYTHLVNTAPLKELGVMISNLPAEIKKSFNNLKHNTVYVLNLAASGRTKNGHWYYFPEDKYPFYRVGIQSSFSTTNAPQNTCSFYIEFGAPQNGKIDFKKFEKLTLAHLKELGFIKPDAKILVKDWLTIPAAYAIYDTNYKQAVKNITDYLLEHNIHLLGRYGAWEYSFMEKSMLDAIETVDKLLKI